MHAFRKIIWAADIREKSARQNESLRILRELAGRTRARIEPVYVLSGALLGLTVPRAKLARYFQEPSERVLKELVKKSGLKNVARPRVIVEASHSRGDAARALDRYARGRKADLIFVNSHGRQGVRRAVLGSFAETLTLHSRTPVLITGPHTHKISKLDRILFPTDFSRPSRRAFEKVCAMAKRLRARVTLIHVVVNPIEPFFQSGAALLGGGYVSTQGGIEQVYERQKSLAERWSREARAKGVSVETAFDVNSTSVAESVLLYARRRKVGLIAMSAESGALSAALLGSVGRGIGREAPCPVWFLRS